MKNYSDSKGAQELANTIKDFWKQRGYNVKTKLVPSRHIKESSIFSYDVKTDMVNGLPKDFKFARK